MGNSNTRQVARQSRSARKAAHLPVSINKDPGFTRDISATGMFIIMQRQQKVGSHVEFTLDLNTPMGNVKFSCEGEVVRIENIPGSDGQVGIGIKIFKDLGRNYVLDNLPADSSIA